MLDFNTEPYNDDYKEGSKFYKILFRPSYAVQARELTQLQTILQNQIKRHGDHVFKQGAMVIPGQMSIDTDFAYVKLSALNSSNLVTESFINNVKGRTIKGSSGITAIVVDIANASETDRTTLYVKYNSSGTGEVKTFAQNEAITTVSEDGLLDYNFNVSSDLDCVGVGSAASIQQGVYYVNGYFVLCESQTILLDKYSKNSSYRIGLDIIESVIIPEDDETLLDNAQNSYNYAAPGAHRHYIALNLSKRSLTDTEDTDFIELSRIENGQIKRQVRSTEYAILEQTMARRTYDESGNYTVRPFEIDVREHRSNNRGAWSSGSYLIGDVVTNAGKTYVAKSGGSAGSTAPTHTSGTVSDGGILWEYNQYPYYNRGIYVSDGDESKLAIGLEPGKLTFKGMRLKR